MKKEWKMPELQILDVSETFNHHFKPGNPNYGGTEPGCIPSGNQPDKCDS